MRKLVNLNLNRDTVLRFKASVFRKHGSLHGFQAKEAEAALLAHAAKMDGEPPVEHA